MTQMLKMDPAQANTLLIISVTGQDQQVADP